MNKINLKDLTTTFLEKLEKDIYYKQTITAIKNIFPTRPFIYSDLLYIEPIPPGSNEIFFIKEIGPDEPVDKKFIISEYSAEVKAPKNDGCNCAKCKQYFPYAEPNQADGTLVCYSCRKNL